MKRLVTVLLVAALGGGCSGLGSLHAPPTIPMGPSAPLAGAAQEVLDREGFVMVSPDKGSYSSFHLGYSALFRAHQPVYVTADAILYAWHASYDDVLADLEETALAPALDGFLAGLRHALSARRSADATARADVETYVAVAESLSSDRPPRIAKAKAIVEEVLAAKGEGDLDLFGDPMKFDFSMLKPRGHYTRSAALSRYFRAMSWLGRVELRVARPAQDGKMRLDRRVLSDVALLRSLVTPKLERTWKMLDDTMAALVGPPDSMSLPGYDSAAKSLGGGDDEILAAFSEVARQRIGTQLAYPGDAPPAFVLLGQRYVFDAHVFGDLTYGKLNAKRMMPTPLDVGFAVFGSGTARKLLEPEVATYGAEYAEALDRMVTERKRAGDALWKGSVYHLWLSALRELSPDAERDAPLPAPLRNEAWGRRLLDAQLASWAELRHDNLLYAKQSVTAYAVCDYPHGYVDPYPRFWATLEAMASKAEGAIARLALPIPVARRVGMTKYFRRFAEIAGRLRAMAERELRGRELDADDLDFLNHMVSVDGRHAGCTTILKAEGWYADLYFDESRALRQDPVIADVHTQPTDEDGTVVGKVLHVGTTYPRTLVVTLAHDGGAHRRTYRGIVSTYAEKTTERFQRIDDGDWLTTVQTRRPAPPDWLKDVVVE